MIRRTLLQARDWIDEQTIRERAMLLVATIVVASVLLYTFLISPLDLQRARVKEEVETLEKQVRALRVESERLAGKLAIDPNEQNRVRKARREEELETVDEQLRDRTENLIPPSEMALVLREILGRQRALQLVQLRSLTAVPLLKEERNTPKVEGMAGRVFRHGFEMEFRGGYLTTLAYLEELENLPWRFFWKELEYEVIEYPEARIHLKVETLSLEEGWIGV
jgi:MSHA biogenesis protein MshJ